MLKRLLQLVVVLGLGYAVYYIFANYSPFDSFASLFSKTKNTDSQQSTQQTSQTQVTQTSYASLAEQYAAEYGQTQMLLDATQEDATQSTGQIRKTLNYVSTEDLQPTKFTPKTYVLPVYDPFNNPYAKASEFQERVEQKLVVADAKPYADFTVQHPGRHFTDDFSGTKGSTFIFNANQSSDAETAFDRLMVRWFFEDPTKPDTFFSTAKSAKHIFEKVGDYKVKLEVMDRAGNISWTYKNIKIVNNTNPQAHFTYNPLNGTPATIFEFHTEKSTSSQYLSTSLKYRFDWNNDGNMDTKPDGKTIWKHKFETPGNYRVVMEAQDEEGGKDYTYADIVISQNTAPIAEFVMAPTNQYSTQNFVTYSFDAGASSDAETPKNKLLFRWDFNYTGEDDIAFDTQWAPSIKISHSFNPQKPTRAIRLQVKDLDSEISEKIIQFSFNPSPSSL